MLELEDAQSRILAALPQPSVERVSLQEAHRRIAAESVHSPRDLPLFDNSAVDGYAVRSSDVTAASPQSPVRLQLVGRVVAGDYFNGELGAGQCVRLLNPRARMR
jgi:molybdopterin molybdotransferase